MILKDYKVLKRVEGLASGILGHKVVAKLGKGGIRSFISTNPEKEPSFIEIDTDIIKYYSDLMLRAVIFHEIGHHKYSPPVKPKTKLPLEIVDAIEEQRIETKLCAYIEEKQYNRNIISAIKELRRSGYVRALTELKQLPIDKDLKIFIYLNSLLHHHFDRSYYINGFFDEIRNKYADSEIIKIRKALNLTMDAITNNRSTLNVYEHRLKELYADDKNDLQSVIKRVEKVWAQVAKLLDLEKKPDKKTWRKLTQLIKKHDYSSDPASQLKEMDYTPSEFDKLIGQTLGRQLQTALVNKAKTRFQSSLKSGKFDVRNAAKLLRDRIDVFKRRQVTSSKNDYQFGLGIDTSGSMGDFDKILYAKRASYILNEAFTFLKSELRYFQFSDSAGKVKSINEVLTLEVGGGTNTFSLVDLMAVEKTHKPNTKKINIVLSDGQDRRLSAAYVQTVEKKYNCKFIGVGLGLNDTEALVFKNEFPEVITVKNAEDLPAAFSDLVRHLIL